MKTNRFSKKPNSKNDNTGIHIHDVWAVATVRLARKEIR